MKTTEIWQINDNGVISKLAVYTCEAHMALTCYYHQFLRHLKNNNTWQYGSDLAPMMGKKMPHKNEYTLFTGENTSIFTRTVTS